MWLTSPTEIHPQRQSESRMTAVVRYTIIIADMRAGVGGGGRKSYKDKKWSEDDRLGVRMRKGREEGGGEGRERGERGERGREGGGGGERERERASERRERLLYIVVLLHGQHDTDLMW